MTPGLRDRDIEMIMRAASLGAIVYSLVAPGLVLGVIATSQQPSSHTLTAVAATAAYLPLYIHIVRLGLRGARPSPLTILMLAIVIVGVTPIIGSAWLQAWGAVGTSVLIGLRPRWAIPALVVVLGTVVVLSAQLGTPAGTGAGYYGRWVWYLGSVMSRSMVMFVLVWLVGALRWLRVARVALADEAVAVERQRLDDELRRTVGADLAVVVDRGIRAGDLVETDTGSSAAELQQLVDGSRHTLAAARRLIASYKTVSPRARIDTAATLLRAAGIEVDVEVPDDELPDGFDDRLASSLRALTTHLLESRPTGPVIIHVVQADGVARLHSHARDVDTRSPAGSAA